jgi:heme exporter protein C
VITGFAGLFFLARRREDLDRLAIASAEVGVVFCTLMLITGPIWARGTWGTWWSWDARLTVTLLLWFVYLAYLLLRSFSGNNPRTARFAAIYGVLGLVLIPLNYYVIEIFGSRSMHPENLERGSLGDGMGLPFALGNLTLALAFFYLLLLRWEVEARRNQRA